MAALLLEVVVGAIRFIRASLLSTSGHVISAASTYNAQEGHTHAQNLGGVGLVITCTLGDPAMQLSDYFQSLQRTAPTPDGHVSRRKQSQSHVDDTAHQVVDPPLMYGSDHAKGVQRLLTIPYGRPR